MKEGTLTGVTVFDCECGFMFLLKIKKNPRIRGWIVMSSCPKCDRAALPSEGRHVAQEVDTETFYEINIAYVSFDNPFDIKIEAKVL